MKPVRCSWVDMLKIREALAAGDQKRLEQMRCVDHSTVSTWKAACDLLDAVEGKCEISHIETFQPSHALEVVRHFRKIAGRKPEEWSEEVKEQMVEWVERVEADGLTVQQLRQVLVSTNGNGHAPADTCEVVDLQRLIDDGKTFGTVYADPPWQYENQSTRASTSNHYGTMTVDDICALPIAALASPSSCLFLWTTGVFLPHSFKVIEAWGFEYKTYAVWVKPQLGIGNYFRKSSELLMVATRGGCQFTRPVKRDWFEHDRLRHSQKPELFRRVIEAAAPVPRIELFGRRLVDGWAVWGNEIERGMFDHDVRSI